MTDHITDHITVRETTAEPADSRARNGGTSTPVGSSVWDLPVAPVPVDAPVPDTPPATLPPELVDGCPPTRSGRAAPIVQPFTTPPNGGDQAVGGRPPRRPLRTLWRRLDGKVLVVLAVIAVAAFATWMLVRNDGDRPTLEAVPTTAISAERSEVIAEPVAPEAEPVLTEPVPAIVAETAPAPTQPIAAPTSVPQAPTPEPDTTGVPSTADDEAPAPMVVDLTGRDAATSSSVPAAGDAVVPTDGRTVQLVSTTEPCRFSPTCLKVGFELVGFAALPGEFVCEFSSGARYTFELDAPSVEYACATGRIGDSITIEVDGVRSETLVHG